MQQSVSTVARSIGPRSAVAREKHDKEVGNFHLLCYKSHAARSHKKL